MDLSKVDLVIHPVRLRILQTLSAETLTTQQIAERLPDVPKSSIYRHLKLLRQSEMVEVAQTRLVQGIQERAYRLAQSPRLQPEDMADLTADAHFGAFTTYVMTLLQDFATYLSQAEGKGGKIDLLADRVGYTEVLCFATEEELDAFSEAVNKAVSKLMPNKPGHGRHRHKIAFITYPVINTENES